MTSGLWALLSAVGLFSGLLWLTSHRLDRVSRAGLPPRHPQPGDGWVPYGGGWMRADYAEQLEYEKAVAALRPDDVAWLTRHGWPDGPPAR